MEQKTIKKLLIANRGEIANRIIRTCKDMGIYSIVVFSEADKYAPFVKKADEAFYIGPSQPEQSYLNIDKIINAAKQTNADAIHPGYGFLAENSDFAQQCCDSGFIFIGPSAKTIKKLGNKAEAKKIAHSVGVPVIPGFDASSIENKRLRMEIKKIGFPVLLKAAMGGGGKGMRVIWEEKQIENAIDAVKREALNAFGNDSIIVEKYFESVKHIEVQILGDNYGNYLHFYERECTIQRRHQKLIEESPSSSIKPALRQKLCADAVKIAEIIQYENLGTVEFIVDQDGNHYFLEVNTRLQVEHPVTEMITGVDLVKMQLLIAEKKEISTRQEDIKINGHAIECRICAENPEDNFSPVSGKVLKYYQPEIANIRNESDIEAGSNVSVFYDSMIAKIISWDTNREQSIRKLNAALGKVVLHGIKTNKTFLRNVLHHNTFCNQYFDTHFIDTHLDSLKIALPSEQKKMLVIPILLWEWQKRKDNAKLFKHIPSGWRNNFYQPQKASYQLNEELINLKYHNTGKSSLDIEINGEKYLTELIGIEKNSLQCMVNGSVLKYDISESNNSYWIHHQEHGEFNIAKPYRYPEILKEENNSSYVAPISGEVVKVLAKPGMRVKSGDPLVVISSMKMENAIEALSDGEVKEVFINEKTFVEAGSILLEFE